MFCLDVCLCTMCKHGTFEGQERVLNPAGVRDSCELPSGCWEQNPDPLQKQQVLLGTKPSSSSTIYLWVDF